MQTLAELSINPIFQAFAGGASIVSILWIFFEVLRRKVTKVYFGQHNEALFSIGDLPFDDVGLIIEGREVVRVSRSLFLLTNKSKFTLVDVDFVECPRVNVREEKTVFGFRVWGGPGLGQGTLSWNDGKLVVDRILLRKGEGLLFEIYHDDEQRPAIEGVLKDQGDLTEYDPVFYVSNRIMPVVGVAYLSIVLLFIVPTIFQGASFSLAQAAVLVGVMALAILATLSDWIFARPAERSFQRAKTRNGAGLDSIQVGAFR